MIFDPINFTGVQALTPLIGRVVEISSMQNLIAAGLLKGWRYQSFSRPEQPTMFVIFDGFEIGLIPNAAVLWRAVDRSNWMHLD